jgi:hypothetical protein
VRRFSISLSLVLTCLCLSAQPKKSGEAPATDREAPLKQNSILVITGYDLFKDQNLHPKVFRGPGIGVLFEHSKTDINIQEWNAGLRFSALNTTFDEFPSAAAINLRGQYTYFFRVAVNGQMQYYIGPVGDIRYGTSAYFNWDESHLYYANHLAGGIGSRISYTSGSKTIDFNLDIPLLSVISRPALNRQYKIDNMKPGGILTNLASNPEFALPNHNFYIRSGIELNYISKHMKHRAVGCRFMYQYMKTSVGNAGQNAEYSISYQFFF